MSKIRIDALLVLRGLAADPQQAAALLMSGRVLVEEQRIDKPGCEVDSGAALRIKAGPGHYVSRGGLKLEGALRDLSVDVRDCICLDLGASTGGFTDCLLQAGAARVHAVDVGRGLLDWKLQQNPRVVIHDRTNVRDLTPDAIGEDIDLITADLSFISLRLVLPALARFAGARILALCKPQFEAAREQVPTGGIIKDPEARRRIIQSVESHIRANDFRISGGTSSSLPGAGGNIEYFLLFQAIEP